MFLENKEAEENNEREMKMSDIPTALVIINFSRITSLGSVLYSMLVVSEVCTFNTSVILLDVCTDIMLQFCTAHVIYQILFHLNLNVGHYTAYYISLK